MNKAKERNSNLELYRIIVMLLIIAHHYVVNSGLLTSGGPVISQPTSAKSLFLLLFGAWGKTGINCFVLITGYFMCKSQITFKKFMKLFLQVMFYRILITSIFWISSYEPFTVKRLIKTLIPIRTIGAGFTPAFLLFFLYIPFLNILINNMNEKQHVLLLSLVSFTYIFLGTLPFFDVTMNYVSWFIILYFISSYIRMYPKKIFENTKLWGWASLLFIIIASLSVLVCTNLSIKLDRQLWYFFVQDSNTLLAVLVGLSSFLFFKNINMKHSPIINKISATCFGVLLIHANSDIMRKWLWQDILNNVGMYHSQFFIVHAILSVLCVFAICSILDIIRITFIEAPFFRQFDKIEYKIRLWLSQTSAYICEKYNKNITKKGK